MAKQKAPTAKDRANAIQISLSGIANDVDLGELASRLEPLHPKNNTFPGEVLLELAADAIEESGASRDQPLEFEGIRKRHLPEDWAHTRAQHHKADYALRAAAMVRAGVDPGLPRPAKADYMSFRALVLAAIRSVTALVLSGIAWA
jgi:hypothetical protein